MSKKLEIIILMLLMCTNILGGCTTKGKGDMTSKDSGGDFENVENVKNLDPFGKYEKAVTVTGVLSFSAPPSNVPSDVTPDTNTFITEAEKRMNIDFEWL